MIPIPSTWLIRASLLYMLTGMIIGAGMLAAKALPEDFAIFWIYLPLHIELLLIGWTLQLFMGTAYWILPKYPVKPIRGPEWQIWVVFLLLNTGLLIFSIGAMNGFSTLLFLGRLLESISFLLFVFLMWPRIRPFLHPPQTS